MDAVGQAGSHGLSMGGRPDNAVVLNDEHNRANKCRAPRVHQGRVIKARRSDRLQGPKSSGAFIGGEVFDASSQVRGSDPSPPRESLAGDRQGTHRKVMEVNGPDTATHRAGVASIGASSRVEGDNGGANSGCPGETEDSNKFPAQ